MQPHIQSESGHRYGNFPNYYTFHEVDERLDCISDEFIVECFQLRNVEEGAAANFTLCDIGSNSGDLTKKLHDRVETIIASSLKDRPFSLRTLGIELDESLVERARIHNSNSNAHCSIQYETLDVSNTTQLASVVKDFLGNDRSCINLVTCFSTTMWVHLKCGDVCFQSFLKQTADFSNNIIIEPQPWKCYRNVICFVLCLRVINDYTYLSHTAPRGVCLIYSQAATRLRRQHLPPLNHYDDITARSDENVRIMIANAICGLDTQSTATVTDSVGQKVFKCDVMSDAAGSWKRKILSFTSISTVSGVSGAPKQLVVE